MVGRLRGGPAAGVDGLVHGVGGAGPVPERQDPSRRPRPWSRRHAGPPGQPLRLRGARRPHPGDGRGPRLPRDPHLPLCRVRRHRAAAPGRAEARRPRDGNRRRSLRTPLGRRGRPAAALPALPRPGLVGGVPGARACSPLDRRAATPSRRPDLPGYGGSAPVAPTSTPYPPWPSARRRSGTSSAGQGSCSSVTAGAAPSHAISPPPIRIGSGRWCWWTAATSTTPTPRAPTWTPASTTWSREARNAGSGCPTGHAVVDLLEVDLRTTPWSTRSSRGWSPTGRRPASPARRALPAALRSTTWRGPGRPTRGPQSPRPGSRTLLLLATSRRTARAVNEAGAAAVRSSDPRRGGPVGHRRDPLARHRRTRALRLDARRLARSARLSATGQGLSGVA